VGVTSVDVQQALYSARRDLKYMLEIQDAETKRLLIHCALLGVLAIAALASLVLAGPAAAAAGSAAAAGEAAAVPGMSAIELATVSSKVVSLAATRAAAGVSRAAIAEIAPRIAASVSIVYLGSQEFEVPPEVAGLCIAAGCEVGEASTPAIPMRRE
jgi:hypothetical protein